MFSPVMKDNTFTEFVLDQLAALSELRVRSMFGAQGMYQAGRFFAILEAGRLFFKTNAATAAAYVERGMGPFTYQKQGQVMTLGYHEVPPEVLENAPELVLWAQRAIALATPRPARPPSKKRR